jgi:hypothetical protein
MQVMPTADEGVQQESAAGADVLAMSAADAGVHQESGAGASMKAMPIGDAGVQRESAVCPDMQVMTTTDAGMRHAATEAAEMQWIHMAAASSAESVEGPSMAVPPAEAFLASAKEAEVHGGGMRLAGTAPSQTYVVVPAVAKEEPVTSLMSPGALAAATSPRHVLVGVTCRVKGLGTRRCCATAETWQAKLSVDSRVRF